LPKETEILLIIHPVLQALDYTRPGGHLYVFVHITHLNRIMHHIQRKKVGVGAKVRNGKVYGIPVKIWDEWVKIAIDEEITLLNVQALSGADAKNRLKG